jgi:hypothetical protein
MALPSEQATLARFGIEQRICRLALFGSKQRGTDGRS